MPWIILKMDCQGQAQRKRISNGIFMTKPRDKFLEKEITRRSGSRGKHKVDNQDPFY